MTTPVPTPLRGLRAAVFGTSALVLAAAAHAIAGGPLPSPSVLLVVGLPLGCASVVLARRARRLPTLLAFLAVGQVVMHEAFMTASTTPSCGTLVGSAHTMHGGPATTSTSGACSAPMDMAGRAAASPLMVAAHALAVVAVALLLAHGERLALRLWAWAQHRLTPAPTRVPVPVAPARTFSVAQLVPRLVARSDLSRRGPPRAAAPFLSFA